MEVKTVTETHCEHDQEEDDKFEADKSSGVNYSLTGCLEKGNVE